MTYKYLIRSQDLWEIILSITSRVIDRIYAKARSGLSLELQAKRILIEEKLDEGVQFSSQPESEKGKKPDFLFPSEDAYKDRDFPSSKLRMLAVKTTCRDRWRQVLTEADRIPTKHLLTLQEGVSENQFNEMKRSNVQLVVPRSLVPKYPKSVQQSLMSLEGIHWAGIKHHVIHNLRHVWEIMEKEIGGHILPFVLDNTCRMSSSKKNDPKM